MKKLMIWQHKAMGVTWQQSAGAVQHLPPVERSYLLQFTIAPRPFKCSNQMCLTKSTKLQHKQNQTCHRKVPPKSDTTFNLPGQSSNYMHVKGMSTPQLPLFLLQNSIQLWERVLHSHLCLIPSALDAQDRSKVRLPGTNTGPLWDTD